MRIHWRRFALWATLLFGLALWANWPKNGGALKTFLWDAGFPLRYAYWTNRELQSFSAAALIVDVFIAAAIILSFSLLLSRRRQGPENLP
jgi:hypothetical protein